MKNIFIDFEMNPIAKKHFEARRICKSEIIQIGAIMLDEDYNEISNFKKFVKPSYSTAIYKFCEDLTGINMGMLIGADRLDKVMADFIRWCGDDYTIYAWSENDKSQLSKEMQLKNIRTYSSFDYLLENWVDFQEQFDTIVQSEKLLSLESALNLTGIAFSGNKHDALFDARNTATLFKETKTTDLLKIINNMKEIAKPDSSGASLGDLFNFSALDLQSA